MTRIIGGTAGGRRLKTPAGDTTRPTSDRVREALFSAVEAQLGTLAGRRFLDVYAGSGAVGLEARSRGADQVVLVEEYSRAAALIRSNAAMLGLDAVTVLVSKAERLPQTDVVQAPFDVAFFDPPYAVDSARLAQVLTDLAAAGWFTPDALIVVERPRRDDGWVWPPVFVGARSKKYGQTMLWYGHMADTTGEGVA
jgi:16S rRNA (guanine966-N2)-methyltransferase